ncbi:hypothetical protein Ccrd_009426 [Cynara cardunculus var. scolymus]|uniref:Uncharacterized protein n=1 Tax=Cynara cardunculus var. scolymus TaxID=59895 RepID=A0A118K7F6_CYNCS|nr:hypothetical protein Ccrd_009426 [Cynara cardunculus var. scolymus]
MKMEVHLQDEPEGKVHASLALFFQSTAFFLISFPLSLLINSITNFSTSSLFTSFSISMATPHLRQLNQQFVNWSEKNGQQIIGTPLEILSIVEFHPQCNLFLRAPPNQHPSTTSFFQELWWKLS